MSSSLNASAFDALVKRLKSSYQCADILRRPPIEEFIYAFLLWEANTTKADNALGRIQNEMIDYNELRVCRIEEISSILGKQYPRGEERALRLKTALHEIYLREHAVDLDHLKAQNKRDVRKYLDSINGCPQFVAARVALVGFDAHAVPIDDKLLESLIAEEIFEPDMDIPRASGALERKVKAADGILTHQLFQAWIDEGAPTMTKRNGGRSRKSASKGTSRKKTTRQKTRTKTG